MIRKMRFFVLMGFVTAFLMASTVSFAAKDQALKDAEGKSYYTMVNIWYEDPTEIFSTNYHKGQMLPMNTLVKIDSIKKNSIIFTDSKNVTYTVQIVRKHTTSPMEKIFNNYFSRGQVSLMGFNGEERKNIEAGTIVSGMSKNAVIAAYGYPPEHMTPSLEGDQWKYWKDRFRNFIVFFNKNGKVDRMGDE